MEGEATGEKLVHGDTQRPHVTRFFVSFVFTSVCEDFGGHVEFGADDEVFVNNSF